MQKAVEFRADSSPRRTIRLAVYGMLAIGVVLGLAKVQGGAGLIVVFAIATAVVLGMEWLLLHKVPAKGEVVLRLSPRGITSAYFSGGHRKLRWEGIESAAVEGAAQARLLRLRLHPQWVPYASGRHARQAVLSLQTLDAHTQEVAIDAITHHLEPTRPMAANDEQPARVRNDLRDARELQERLQRDKPVPWAVVCLIALNVLAWVAVGLRGGGWIEAKTLTLLALGGNTTSAVQAGEWWRLLSATFLHGGLMHLLFNMVGLWIAGSLLERIFGSRQFLLIYVVSGVAGSVASLYFAAQTAVAVGASGAVFGVAGALLTAVAQHRKQLPRLFSGQILGTFSFYLVYSLVQGFTKPGIDNAAHLGGLLAGALLAWLLPERFDIDSHRQLRTRRMVAAAVAAALVLPAAAMLAPPARRNLAGEVQALEQLPQIARDFQAAAQALQREANDVKAGRTNELDADEASRRVHAPRFLQILQRLQALDGQVPPAAQVHVTRLLTLTRALHESLAMPSVIVDGKPQPANPQRAAELRRIIEQAAREAASKS
ncbi:MAG: rhomboid family intramembrane serine protease [Hydrogenophaga sp.]|uniref:rhomboid family intramembrane serine protease n=1 Tax=Hydrogenophaga sp. TaxID=1904254 RepID=UPI001D1EDBBD|nr:rhomboid family intramembrane serine protease [Hydrogenophaga sp.]MBX3608779.1 rhomboid family intramembrane serine protease [Hydrogenophaga sp.]